MKTQSQKIELPAMYSEEIAQLQKMCLWASSYSRAEVLLSNRPTALRGGRVVGTEWFKVLGEWWSTCDNISDHRHIFRSILKRASRAQLHAMMNEEERENWAQLPDTIQAWRGCDAYDHTGLSFSLSVDTAEGFPFLMRYRTKSPTLITAIIPKKFAVLKLDRNEDEIISPVVTIISRQPITLEGFVMKGGHLGN
jgi:hypothetical protein